MPRIGQRVNFNTFSGGKISDANPVNPPENAARTLLNVNIEENGKVGRRLGLEVEDNFNLPTDPSTGDYLDRVSLEDLKETGLDIYEWSNVGNTPGIFYRVVRIGNTLYIYDEGGEVLSNSLIKTVDISGFSVGNSEDAAGKDFQAVSGKGYLFCSGSKYQPFYVKHDTTTGAWSSEGIEILVRDFDGVDDGLELTERPLTLSSPHLYNITNQGWPRIMGVAIDDDGDDYLMISPAWALRNYASIRAYPSNSDICYLGKTSNATDPDTVGAFSPWSYDKVVLGNTKAPSGHFIIDPFGGSASKEAAFAKDDDSYNKSTSVRVSLDYEAPITARPKSVAFYAGRVWFGSVNGRIFYSKIIQSDKDFGKCYQEQDPTAEDLNELLDTDGGYLTRPEIGDVLRMIPLGRYLVVFGDNGVWAVSGGDQPFTANSQQLTAVSKITPCGYKSIVAVEGGIFFWSESGIYVVREDPSTGYLVVEPVSEGRIQRDFYRIPSAAKKYALGVYDRTSRTLYWAYSYHSSDSEDVLLKYTDVLIFDLNLTAFWDYRLTNAGYSSSTDPYPMLVGLFSGASTQTGTSLADVTSSIGKYVAIHSYSTLKDRAYLGASVTSWGAVTHPTVDDRPKALIHSRTLGVTVVVSGWLSGEEFAMYSTDGETWIETTLPPGGGLHPQISTAGIWSETLGQFIVLGYAGRWTSSNGIDWTFTAWGATNLRNVYGRIIYVDDWGLFIAGMTSNNSASYNKQIITSSNGTDWSLRTTPGIANNAEIFSLAYGNGVAVAIADDGTLTSTDGASWSDSSTPGSWSGTRGLAFSPSLGLFVAINGSNDNIAYSSDGINWTVKDTTNDTGVSSYFGSGSIIWSEESSCFVIVARSNAWTSSDGINWSVHSVTTDSVSLTEVVGFPSNEVVTDGGSDVTVDVPYTKFSNTTLKAAVLLPDSSGDYGLSFGQFSSRTFKDWEGLTAAQLSDNENYLSGLPVAEMTSGDYSSVIETLPITLGEPSVVKQATYLHTFCDYRRDGYGELEVPDEFDS